MLEKGKKECIVGPLCYSVSTKALFLVQYKWSSERRGGGERGTVSPHPNTEIVFASD